MEQLFYCETCKVVYAIQPRVTLQPTNDTAEFKAILGKHLTHNWRVLNYTSDTLIVDNNALCGINGTILIADYTTYTKKTTGLP